MKGSADIWRQNEMEVDQQLFWEGTEEWVIETRFTTSEQTIQGIHFCVY